MPEGYATAALRCFPKIALCPPRACTLFSLAIVSWTMTVAPNVVHRLLDFRSTVSKMLHLSGALCVNSRSEFDHGGRSDEEESSCRRGVRCDGYRQSSVRRRPAEGARGSARG